MLRLVRAPDGRLVVDLKGRLPGRGAWVHPRAECLGELKRRPGRLHRGLGEVDASELPEQVRASLTAAALDGLSLAAAAGALVGGRQVLEGALRDGRVLEVVVARDASVRTLTELRRQAGEVIPFTSLPLDTAELGARVGKGPRAALGVLPSRASSYLRRQLHRLRALG